MSKSEKYEVPKGSFGWALEELKRGEIIMRASQRYAIFLQKVPEMNGVLELASFSIGTKLRGNWNCHQDDLFADDWILYKDLYHE